MSWLPLLIAESDPWGDMFFGLEPENRFVLLIVAIGCTTAIAIMGTITLGSVLNAVHRRRAEYDLKREMLDRGMTAEEVAQVIEAAPQPEEGIDRWIASWAKHKQKR